MDAAERLQVAKAAGVRGPLRIDFGVPRREFAREPLELGAPLGALLVPAHRRRLGARKQTGRAPQSHEPHVAGAHLREGHRRRIRLRDGEIERQLRLVGPFAANRRDRRAAGLVVDHDALAGGQLVDSIEAQAQLECPEPGCALPFGREHREPAPAALMVEPRARETDQPISLDCSEAPT